MRLGIVLPGSDALASEAQLAEQLGFDLVWIRRSTELAAPLVVAAALAAKTKTVRLVAEADADDHPIAVAEDAAVADLSSNGRLVLTLCHDGDGALLGEFADVVMSAHAARPFRHIGQRWRLPAHLPGQRSEEQMRVSPPPAQLELPLWLCGPAAPAAARERGLSHVAEGLASAASDWHRTEAALQGAARRLRRPALVPVDARFGVDALVESLLAARSSWGLDVAVIDIDSSDPSARRDVLRALATAVRPRVQLHRLPAHLDAAWRGTAV